jgi:hypothetical protein
LSQTNVCSDARCHNSSCQTAASVERNPSDDLHQNIVSNARVVDEYGIFQAAIKFILSFSALDAESSSTVRFVQCCTEEFL